MSKVKSVFQQVFKCPKSFQKGQRGPFESLLGDLKHFFKHSCHVRVLLLLLLDFLQNVPHTFSDTLELPDTLPDTVLVTFNDFSKFYTRLKWPSIMQLCERKRMGPGCNLVTLLFAWLSFLLIAKAWHIPSCYHYAGPRQPCVGF